MIGITLNSSVSVSKMWNLFFNCSILSAKNQADANIGQFHAFFHFESDIITHHVITTAVVPY